MGLFSKKARTPADVQADITALNEAIAAKEAAIQALDAQVRQAVASGGMSTADSLDADVVREQQVLERLKARSAILVDALAAAEDEAANVVAREAHDRATAALAIGHSLLSDYEKQAKALASTLEKLAAIEHFIERTNGAVDGRAAAVESLYHATRYAPAKLAEGIECWWEYPGHGRAHPDHPGWVSADGETYNRRPPPPLCVGEDERRKPVYVEAVLMRRTVPNAIVVERHRHERPIDELARLPGCKLDDLDLWNETRRHEAQVKADRIVSALLEKRKA